LRADRLQRSSDSKILNELLNPLLDHGPSAMIPALICHF
jgi:hypothetical protein